MDARRAQDILRHIINDEDYGAAMLDKISVTESIEVLTKMLPDCVATAQNDNNINDAGFFSQMIHKDRKSTRLNSSHSGESRMPSSA